MPLPRSFLQYSQEGISAYNVHVPSESDVGLERAGERKRADGRGVEEEEEEEEERGEETRPQHNTTGMATFIE